MKRIGLVLTLFIFCNSFSYAQSVNEKMVKYCKSQMGKKVDRGECWDLIAFALNNAGANWNKYDVYGEVYEYKKDGSNIKAGDVIEFNDVKFENPDGTWFTMYEHYAIVYEVKKDGALVIVHQNHNNIRKVQTLEIDVNNLTKGKLTFYRPI